MKKQLQYYGKAILNSYSILFFSQNKILGMVLLLVSFFIPTAGFTGLLCAVFALVLTTVLGFGKESIASGLYSFNALLLGIGFGSFYNFNFEFWLWLASANLLCIILSVNLSAWLGKYALPTLSIPFVITFWLVLIATNGYAGMGMLQKSSSIIFELSTSNISHFTRFNQYIDNLNIPVCLSLFFRSVSAVLFQNSILAGILISIGLFIHSRIGFSLLVIGFFTAYLLNQLTGTYPEGISNYHLGANFMMVSCAIGGFFLIPSYRSYLWAIVAIPFTFLLVNGLSRVLGAYNLPIFSMPFCLITNGMLYFFILRAKPKKLQLTTFQNYSPETNLYQFLNGQTRLKDFKYFHLNLPFMGAWTISQGYEGTITHKGEWNQALDFVLQDLDGKTYEMPGTKPEHYYCFNKPILATADGIVQEVISHIEDNEIGQINMQKNWGNTIVIKHGPDLYSKVSHLKKNTIKVKVGDFVKQGEIIANCGNSGRSPEPHLHFQMQATPYVGSKTLAYPFANYTVGNGASTLKYFEIPKLSETIQSPEINPYLKQAFNFKPGYSVKIKDNNHQEETWEIFTDALNSTYFYCYETQAIAYFVNNSFTFYFTRFYGNRKSMLYLFYLANYKINFSAHAAHDEYANDAEVFKPSLWFQDIISPFYIFSKNSYQNNVIPNTNGLIIKAEAKTILFKQEKAYLTAKIKVDDQGISAFEINYKNQTLIATWETNLS